MLGPRAGAVFSGSGPAPGTAGARAFTLVELLVAIGAVALLALGIAQIFAVTGQTVAAGRRLSNLQSSAAVMERQLRADFSGMTRDGFLLIRQQRTGSATRVHPEDEDPRVRRLDEVVFFANGQFTSLRDPRHPDFVASARTARIYYGHGLRQNPGAAGFGSPALNDRETLPDFGAPGVNRYARDWALLRHVALLAEPAALAAPGLEQPIPPGLVGANTLQLVDQARQYKLQPAAMSVFRTLARNLRPDAANPLRGATAPEFGSGLIDIAMSSMAEVRSTVLLYPRPGSIGGNYVPPPLSQLRFLGADEDEPGGARARERMQEWMIDALPAAPSEVNVAERRRMRFEYVAPNLAGLPNPNTQDDGQRGDQLMLASSVFQPHCTEFIVEWTFGQVDLDPLSPTYQRLIWYGLERSVDVNLNGAVDANDYYVRPYSDPSKPIFRPGFRRADGQLVVNTYDADQAERTRPWYVRPELVERFPLGPNGNIGYACFGFVDPIYAPDTRTPGALLYDANPPPPGANLNQHKYEYNRGDTLRDPDTIPWAWPTLVRVTVVLVDPQEPGVEQRFQFILPTPGNARTAAN